MNVLDCNASNESVHAPGKLGYLPKANWFDENLLMFFKTIVALTDHATVTSNSLVTSNATATSFCLFYGFQNSQTKNFIMSLNKTIAP